MDEDKSFAEERWTFADLVSDQSVPVDEGDLLTKSGDPASVIKSQRLSLQNRPMGVAVQD
jgi:hypothetical protein